MSAVTIALVCLCAVLALLVIVSEPGPALTFDDFVYAHAKDQVGERKIQTADPNDPCENPYPVEYDTGVVTTSSYVYEFNFSSAAYCAAKFGTSTSGSRSGQYRISGAVPPLECGIKVYYPDAANWVEVWHCDEVESRKAAEKLTYTVDVDGYIHNSTQVANAARTNYFLTPGQYPRPSHENYPTYDYPKANPCTWEVEENWLTPYDCELLGLTEICIGMHSYLKNIPHAANG